MKFAYADPPYLGCCKLYDHHHPDSRCWDEPSTHLRLIERLTLEYPDGWALSGSSSSLRTILPFCPEDVRVMPWVKPFAIFKPNVGVAYAWEPIIVRGGRRRTRQQPTMRDWCAENITLRRGFTGAKPQKLCWWLFEVLGMTPGDEFTDLFPGSGAVSRAWEAWKQMHGSITHDLELCEHEYATPSPATFNAAIGR